MVIHKRLDSLYQRKELSDDYFGTISICHLKENTMSPHQLSTRFFTEQETKTTLFTEALTNDSGALNTVLSDSRRLRRVSKKNSRNKPNDTTSSTQERWYTSIRSVYPPYRRDSKETHEYLFVAIDDFSRELFASILPDKAQYSSETFLKQVLNECAYTIEQSYSDNGLEYKGNPENHAFMKLCTENKIEQRFTKVKTPRTNGKAESHSNPDRDVA